MCTFNFVPSRGEVEAAALAAAFTPPLLLLLVPATATSSTMAIRHGVRIRLWLQAAAE